MTYLGAYAAAASWPADPAETDAGVRVRFAPAPSGDLHVGSARTALFNWLYARHTGGTFVLRVEDTDRSRVTDASFHAVQDALRWLGLDWDEGPGVGGPFAPYRQSERLETYADAAAQLQEQDAAYPCFCTQEEVKARNAAAGRLRPGYDGHCRDLDPGQVAAGREQGREPVLRFRVPAGTTTVTDVVRGQVTVDHAEIDDFTLTRRDGHPLYLLANTVDDALMGITHVVRGEDLLSAAPRQVLVLGALGVPAGRLPTYAHLPLIVGEDGKPLSKRHGDTAIEAFRAAGTLPAAMVNYLALLGWSPGEQEVLPTAELVARFDLARVSRNPARFDARKLAAVNGDKIRQLPAAELADRLLAALAAEHLLADPPTAAQVARVAVLVPLMQTRMDTVVAAVEQVAFLLVDDAGEPLPLVVEEAAAGRWLVPDQLPVLAAAAAALGSVQPWEPAALHAALEPALVEGLGLSRKKAFAGALRVAVTGRTVGPPLFESMVLLGREVVLRRLGEASARAGGGG